MFTSFSNFLLCAVYPSVAIHHEQCIFIIYDLYDRERDNFQQLLKLIEPKLIRAFNRSGATQAVTLDIFKAFDRVCHAYLLRRLKSCEISGQIFGHVLSLFSNIRLQVTKDGTFSQ